MRRVRCTRKKSPRCRGSGVARERRPPARLRVSACDRWERGREPPRAARAAPSPRPAPAPPARSALFLPAQSRRLRLGLSGPFIAPRGFPGTRARPPEGSKSDSRSSPVAGG